jgi:oligoendopeptidase F
MANGDTITLSEGQVWFQMGVNRNQDERYQMFETFYHTYQTSVNTYASIYNSVLQRDWATTQARGYASTLEASVDPNQVPLSVYENLVTTVRQGTEPLQRYHQVRRRALGLDEYYWSDRKIPVVEFNKTYEYDEVVPWVIEAVAPLGEEYQARTRELLEGRWVDTYENEGKYSGAFQADAYGQHPYILMNFNGTLGEVFTLAHEAGHALHTMYASGAQPYATAYYTIFVAEVASTLNEALLLEYLLERSDDRLERIALLQQAIDNIAGTFYLQTLFADFEWQAHQLVERGEPVTADVLRGVYAGLLNDYYGDAISIDSLYHSYWTRISHFFQSPYYVYKYATSYASSAKLVAEIGSNNRRSAEAARERYLDLLRSGGSDHPMAQLKAAGVDLSTPKALQAVVIQLDNLVDRLEEELDQL